LSESAELPSRLSIDSGVILAYYLGEDLGRMAQKYVFDAEGKDIFHSRLCIAELFYVICRRRGARIADEYTRSYLNAEYGRLANSDAVDMAAGAYKCERTISLADCYVIATAKLQHATALFARHEKDLDEEINRKPFDVSILFLEDLGK